MNKKPPIGFMRDFPQDEPEDHKPDQFPFEDLFQEVIIDQYDSADYATADVMLSGDELLELFEQYHPSGNALFKKYSFTEIRAHLLASGYTRELTGTSLHWLFKKK